MLRTRPGRARWQGAGVGAAAAGACPVRLALGGPQHGDVTPWRGRCGLRCPWPGPCPSERLAKRGTAVGQPGGVLMATLGGAIVLPACASSANRAHPEARPGGLARAPGGSLQPPASSGKTGCAERCMLVPSCCMLGNAPARLAAGGMAASGRAPPLAALRYSIRAQEKGAKNAREKKSETVTALLSPVVIFHCFAVCCRWKRQTGDAANPATRTP